MNKATVLSLACLSVFMGALALTALFRLLVRLPWQNFGVRCLSWSQRQKLEAKLRHAGLTTWHPSTLVFLKLACTVLGAMGFLWVMGGGLLWSISGGILGFFSPTIWLRQRIADHQARLSRELPFFLDMLCLCLSSGLNLQAAIQLVLEYQPRTALAEHWRRWLANIRANTSRVVAFQQLMSDVCAPAVRRVCVALIQAEQSGAGMATSLATHANQLRQERLMQAERKALQAPVKMLMPLVICFFPSTFLVLGFAMWLNLGDVVDSFS